MFPSKPSLDSSDPPVPSAKPHKAASPVHDYPASSYVSMAPVPAVPVVSAAPVAPAKTSPHEESSWEIVDAVKQAEDLEKLSLIERVRILKKN